MQALAQTEIQLEKKWCPACAAFQLATNPACEKCGASMSRRAAVPLSRGAKCVIWVVALFLALILIGAFHAAGLIIVLAFAFLSCFLIVVGSRAEAKNPSLMSPGERAKFIEKAAADRQARETIRRARDLRREAYSHGQINPRLICPHCQTQGHVRTKQVENKAGISGGKATAAVLTGGWSLLAVGLSRKQTVTAARCGECSSAWQF